MSAQLHADDTLLNELFGPDVPTANSISAAPRFHQVGVLHLPPLSSAITNRKPTTPPSPESTVGSETEHPPGPRLALPRNTSTSTAGHVETDKGRPLAATLTSHPTPEQTPDRNEIILPQSPSKKRKRETPPAQNEVKIKLRCRHGCLITFGDKAAMRIHHNKVHNCFKEGTAEFWCKYCFKRFSNERDYTNHWNSSTFCSTEPMPSNWLFWPPANRQERADTWGYAADGPVSKHLEVSSASDPSEWEELPQPTRPPPKAISINGQLKHAPGQRRTVRSDEILFMEAPKDVNLPTVQHYSAGETSSTTTQNPNVLIDLTNDIRMEVSSGVTQNPSKDIDLTDDFQRGAKRIRLGDNKDRPIPIDD